MMTRLLSVLLIFSPAAPAFAEQPAIGDETVQELDRELGQLTRQLGDWSEQHSLISGIINNLWERNGWNSEADLFARNTALQVEQIPPWKFKERMDFMVRSVVDRYTLDDNQTQQFRMQMFREMGNMTMKYGPVLMKSMREALQARVDNEPFTPEQVARWFKEFEPMMGEWQKDINRFMQEFRGTLNENQQEVFERDRQSVLRRMNYILTSSERWRNGQWTPEDWGLQDDPVHQPRSRRALSAAEIMLQGVGQPHEESTWRQYVRAFINLYRLDDSQQQACTAVLEDLEARAARYRATRVEELKRLNAVQRRDHPLLEPIRAMFRELKWRLSTIPTERQLREAAQRSRIGMSTPAAARSR